jgi:hypothetical protein
MMVDRKALQSTQGGRNMFPYQRFGMWTTGTFTTSATLALNRTRRYLVTGGLIGKQGDAYGHVYISTVCTAPSPDQQLCGVRDIPPSSLDDDIKNLKLVELLPANASRVTIKLRTEGGRHRAEGMIYDIT